MSELGIEITSVCSFNCYFCGKNDRQKHNLSTEVFKRIVIEARELGYDSFVLTPKNGDVFCDPEVYLKLEYLKNQQIPYYFFTNLHLANPEKLIKVISPLGKIFYSEYGKSDEEFEKLTRSPRSFRHKVLKNVEILKDIISPQKRNAEYIVNANKNKSSEKVLNGNFCSQAYHHSVSSNGNVLLCTCGAYNPDLIVGNIIDTSLKDVFTSDLYRDKIKYLTENGMNNEICRNGCNNFRTDLSPKQMIRNLTL